MEASAVRAVKGAVAHLRRRCGADMHFDPDWSCVWRSRAGYSLVVFGGEADSTRDYDRYVVEFSGDGRMVDVTRSTASYVPEGTRIALDVGKVLAAIDTWGHYMELS